MWEHNYFSQALLITSSFFPIIPQANHGGVKGKLPKDVVNQDPSCISQSQETGEASEGREDQSSGEGEGGEEGEEERRARDDPDEVLNESDDDDDSVRIIIIIFIYIVP